MTVTHADDTVDALGECKYAAKVCDDGNPCTDDACYDLTGACVYLVVECPDDGDPCTDPNSVTNSSDVQRNSKPARTMVTFTGEVYGPRTGVAPE